jgi:hypothetical protein
MSSIPGLRVIENFVSPEEEAKLAKNCDQQTWSGLGVRYIKALIVRIYLNQND